jgi:hypothetical protein
MTYINGKLFSDDGALQCINSTPESTDVRINGWAVRSSGDLLGYPHIQNLSSAAVPAGAAIINGLAFTQTGILYVTTDTPSDPVYVAGFAVRADGALHVTMSDVGATDVYLGGWAVAQTGQARIFGVPDPEDLVAHFQYNTGITSASGTVSAWANQTGF